MDQVNPLRPAGFPMPKGHMWKILDDIVVTGIFQRDKAVQPLKECEMSKKAEAIENTSDIKIITVEKVETSEEQAKNEMALREPTSSS
ncbi:hypothetical protein RvY_02320 [Ramazzottius varieornatus]|uniref:Uncharacterized protein n=1 Tax=Ramazzottius varieornatus TaxID=947166 RepID=A0A1D1UJD0_RAMVA|nr:hypothetical protein RvY_02320 [Ramazzottius varieornatus]